jgi:hypothetical protein
MSKKKSPKDLPQSIYTWYFAIRKLNTWTKTDEGEPFRPTAMVIFNLDQGFVQDIGLFKEADEAKAKGFPAIDDIEAA